ncbi:MAG TPA: trimethylamine methyltransferase family protein [Anaerolineae bacterium]
MPDNDTIAAPAYRVLNETQIAAIHAATLKILRETGVRVAHPEGLELLRGAGCQIRGRDVALIPGDLVEQCIASAPSSVVVYDQLGREAMRLEGRRNYFGLGTDLIQTQDLETGRRRTSVLADVANAAHVANACPNIDFIASFALASDVSANLSYVASFKAQLENATKPIFFTAAGREDLAYIIAMAAAVAGGDEALASRPFLINYSEPTPPLTHSFGAVAKLLLCAEKGVPICYTPAAMLGGSAPVTIAGGLVQTNAEALSGIVMHQLKAAGAPIISGVALPLLDMRTSCVSYGAPELRLANSAFADLFHHYRLPMWSSAGSDAHILDAQGAWENATGTLLAALDGANLIHDVAYLGQGLLGDPAAIVMCDEIVAYVKRVIQGFDTSADALALDAIERAGQGGNYLTDEHTLRHFRSAVWQPSLINRANPDAWLAKGSVRYEERARRRALAIMAQPRRERPAAGARLDALMAEAEAELTRIAFVA